MPQDTLADGEAAPAHDSASADSPAALPVAAAVARALMAREAPDPEGTPDPETQALVGRLLDAQADSESPRSV